MPQIAVTVKGNTIEVIQELAAQEDRSFSRMVDILLAEAVSRRILSKPSKSKSQKQKSK